MSQKTIPQSIFGDQTNIKRCVQPPGGNSSIVFGGESVKSDAVKGKNHQASDIFNLGENKKATKKPSPFQQDDTQNRLFGENTKRAKTDDAPKPYNPITGGLPQNVVAKEEEEEHDKKKVAETVSITTTSCTTTTTSAAAAAMPTMARQPPGGKSTKLW